MLKAVIIDDEENARVALSVLIKEHTTGLQVMGMYRSLEEGCKAIVSIQPDVVFLDIQMPDENGLALWKYFPRPGFNVVFTTAYHQYAIQAIKLAAFDYLLKPIDIDDLALVANRLREQRLVKTLEERLEVLEGNLKNQQSPARIALHTADSLMIVRIEDIVRAESDDNYTSFYLADGSKQMVSKTLKEFESLLPKNGFIRIHQSHLVNINFVKKFIKGKAGVVQMADGSKLPVSRERKDAVIEMLTKV